MRFRILLVLAAASLSGGCVSHVVGAIVTAPIKATGAVIDAATTSQAEADLNRGREIRKQEERDAKAQRKREKEARDPPGRDGT